MRRNKIKRRKKRLLLSACIILLLLSIVVWTATGLTRPLVLSLLIDADSARNSTVTETVLSSGLLIKEELLVRAPVGGKITLLVKEGDRIPAGTVVAKISSINLSSPGGTADTVVYAPKAGTVCMHIDGLEGVLTPAAADELELSQIDTIRTNLTIHTEKQRAVEKSQPIIKLVDNLEPIIIYLELSGPKMPYKRLKKGEKIKLKYQDSWFTARVLKSKIQKQHQWILVTAKDYPNEIIHVRNANFEILKKELSGLLIPQRALVYKDNKPGLYKIYQRKIVWVPVEIQGTLKNQVAVKSKELSTGVRYILNPQLVREGDLIF
ncbi:putative membrane fusion protein [Desulfohalotomaculum tongense]|uniref:HlyD family efflux transporter periplasmic adaptor subunit n=1 Tax=Desulforadius tongensis TaxID=1216062 RepID=UPI00195DD357|nr:putative membrane fusion protein [Desulforadius tongensis]